MYDYNKEKMEAIYAGQKALESLRAAKEELDDASTWGIIDIFGGGFVTSLIKRDKMKKAKNYIDRARIDIENFSRELADVTNVNNIELDTDDLIGFFDWFSDNFFSDLMVQSRIKNAKQQVEEAIYRVEYLLNGLR